MATTTVLIPGVGYKTTDENGRVTYSQSQPDTPTPPPASNNAEGGLTSNKTKGVVVVIDKRTGNPVSIPMIGDKIDPAFTKKQVDEYQKRTSEEFRAHTAAVANAKEMAELAEKERLKAGNNYGAIVGFGCKPDVIGAPEKWYEFGIGKASSKDPGNVTVYNRETKIPITPDAAGCKISFKVEVNAPNLYERATDDAKNAQRARDASEKAKEIKEDFDKAKEKFERDFLKNPQAANDQYVKELADLSRKWGKKAGEAALE